MTDSKCEFCDKVTPPNKIGLFLTARTQDVGARYAYKTIVCKKCAKKFQAQNRKLKKELR